MAKSQVQFTLRMPTKLHQELKKLARETQEPDGYKSSINRIVIKALREFLAPQADSNA